MSITYAIVIASLLGVFAQVSERLCVQFDWPRRAPWALALLVSVVVPLKSMLATSNAADASLLSLPFQMLWPEIVPLEIGAAVSLAVEKPWPSLPKLSSLDEPLLVLWIMSSAVMLIVLGAAAFALQRVLRRSGTMTLGGQQVVIAEELGPAVYGFFRPCVILPRRLSNADTELLEMVLRHEQEHVAARDHALLVAALLLVAVMPWNVALWWQLRRLRAAIEVDCDARVLRRGADPASYSEALLSVKQGSGRTPFGAVALTEPVSQLERRIRIMLEEARSLGLPAIGARIVLALSLAGLAVTVNAPRAQQATDNPAAESPRRTPAMRESVYVLLREAQACIEEEEDFACARERMDRVEDMQLNDYERSQLWFFRAFIEFTEGDTPRAIAAYENVLRVPDLVPGLQQQTLFGLAQLYTSVEQYTQALETLDRWMRLVESPSPQSHVLRAQIQYQMGRYAGALESLETGLAAAEPSEQWYSLKLALQSELDDRQGMIETLEVLNGMWPNEDRARQLEALKDAEG